jgi:hypothetical protein
MRLFFAVALLVGTISSFAQSTKDCKEATKAFKKLTRSQDLTQDDFKVAVNALDDACGLPEEYPTAASDCEKTMEAVNRDVDKNGPDPTSSRPDLNRLLAAMHKACGIEGDAPGTVAIEELVDVKQLVAESSSLMNREIALGNRLIAHFKRAQTWEGVDADHPEAKALREKIAHEETELLAVVHEDLALHGKIDMDKANKECGKDALSEWSALLTEAAEVMKDVKTQQDRYHALGY